MSEAGGPLAPLRYASFRHIWMGSILSNLGQFVQNVGAAWAMIQINAEAGQVALVQTASMLPLMVVSIPAGAIADMYDRRVVGLVALTIAFLGAATLAVLTFFGPLTPATLLLFCFLIGCGVALFSPSWQASVSEQVPVDALPAAIGLNSISYNIARGVGPAIGGLIVAMAGAGVAFGTNALLYIPLMIALFLWRRPHEMARLPPERLGRAIIAGMRYVIHSPQINRVLLRAFLSALFVSPMFALTPLVAHDLLHGDAQTYGLLLGAFGAGAVLGGLNLARSRQRFGAERVVMGSMAALSVMSFALAHSILLPLSMAELMISGAAWMLALGLFNVGVQLSAPRWVAGRILAIFSAAVAGGIAIGSWLWGQFAQAFGVDGALTLASIFLGLLILAGRWLAMPELASQTAEAERLADPDVALAITGRSGPISIAIEYRIPHDRARGFYRLMQDVQRTRQRDGAYGWSLGRDIADPILWIERFHCPTWHDYLRLRDRRTEAEDHMMAQIAELTADGAIAGVRRILERPLGSVRWHDSTPDREGGAALSALPE